MNLKECYAAFGGDYDGVIKRLMTETLVKKFLLKFPQDASYDLLINSLDNANFDEAFRAAHTIKGICQNLSFTNLYESSSITTLALKENDCQKAAESMPQLSEDYHRIINAIQMYQSSKGE